MTSQTHDESVLSEAEIKTIKTELLEKRAQILSDLEEITDIDEEGRAMPKVKFPEYGDKLDENAQEIEEFTTNLATDKVLESSLRDIDSALKRIEDGSYGVCKYCQQPIAKKRMQARPVASACVECKTKLQNQF